MFTKKKDK